MAGIDLTNRKSAEELNKLPNPSNERLQELFVNIDKIVIKDDGVYNGKAISTEIVLTISQLEKILKFQELLEVDETNIGFYCMCLGDYAIELHSNNKIKTIIGFHHGNSIRYDGWKSDVGLALCDELACFLYEEGLEKILLEKIKQRKQAREDKIIEDNWFSTAPSCFLKYWDEMNGLDDDYLPLLITEFKKELPDINLQINKLLRTFSVTENFWTAFPIYEGVPFKVLSTYKLSEIITAYNISNKNYSLRMGLGRFLCFFEFKKVRKKHLKEIPQNVIDEVKQSFKLANDIDGLREIEKLNNEKIKSESHPKV